jgi:hypothetical protein
MSNYRSSKEFLHAIKFNDILAIDNNQRRHKVMGKDKIDHKASLPEKLLEYKNEYAFLMATLYAEENDCSIIVKAYEIMTLRLCPGLSNDAIAKLLHIRLDKLSPNDFKGTFGFDLPTKENKVSYIEPEKLYPGSGFKGTFGFDFSTKEDKVSYIEPKKLYPCFFSYWAHMLRNKQPNS